MSDISKMDFKQLRSEVQILRDEIAKMKRMYEDVIYNLDDDNFSSKFIKEKENMKTSIEVTAEGIKTKVSKTDLEKSLSEYSTISQTAAQISSTVTKEYVDNLLGGEYVTDVVLSSKISQSADEIYMYVNETRDDLETSISRVSVTANGFESRVQDLEGFKESTFTQTADGFTLDGDKTTFTGVIYLTDNNNDRRFSIFHTTSSGFVDTGEERILMHSADDYNHIKYIVIGDGKYDDHNVYIAGETDNCLVATQGWVLENAGSGGGSGGVAVFG